ncbi:lytic murein transglycosylase [Hansschlegelia plantiphila]|uniref:Membrane protein n=1 Tax=Hansschlegelia plantiphila TaxID=374655 RepID=A0A9W6IYJ1_9HYPH|nr:lytic murein transglycosylase [Hansschlegelia plantiphila]GLK67530.1 membrane protein [Hansschlegelia plantiphila]
MNALKSFQFLANCRLLLMAAMLISLGGANVARAAPAIDRGAVEAQFQGWLSATVQPAAAKAGVSAATIRSATAGLTLDWSLPDLAPPGAPPLGGPQRQPEFADPGRYVAEANFAALTSEGKAELARWSGTLDSVERRYGVPREIVVAIWGRESRFGKAKIGNVAVRALATEAFMGARKDQFLPELIAALKILDGDHVALAEMKSSWAGAMGQPQFLPSKYLENAVDMDGDGKRDIWNSVPDTLGSIANYLRRHGWKPGRDWGVEVDLPVGVACTFEGPDQSKTVAEWTALGVRPKAGGSLPKAKDAALHLMTPAGRTGPAFLVSDNFYVIKQYNESDLYALFVGHLGDRLRGGGPIQGKWTTPRGVARADIAAMQRRLEAQGHDVGSADGLVGFRTRVAVGRWEAGQGRAQTCFPQPDDVKLIGK